MGVLTNIVCRLNFDKREVKKMSTKRKIVLCVLLLVNIVCLVFVVRNYLELKSLHEALDSIEIN